MRMPFQSLTIRRPWRRIPRDRTGVAIRWCSNEHRVVESRDAGGVDELLVGGSPGGGIFVEVRGGAQRSQIEVDNGVGFREQPCDFGRSFLTQEEDGRESAEDEEDDEQGVTGALAHLSKR